MIYRLFKNAAFGPEDIQRLSTAYEEALRVLASTDRDDPIMQIIAKRIIEVAQTGAGDPAMLCAIAIKDVLVP